MTQESETGTNCKIWTNKTLDSVGKFKRWNGKYNARVWSKSTYSWNQIRQKHGINDFSYKLSTYKTKLLKILLELQKQGVHNHWCDNNFTI